jgi:YaaC-like Protein
MIREDSIESAWSRLRSTRWQVPSQAANDPDRKATYVFALEQAEQMFRAAATVGPPVRPLLLFYGLSQAGRAIAAAAAGDGDNWRLKGHGITAPDLTAPLAEVPVVCSRAGSGSFTRLSGILDSPLWDRATRPPLCAFWDSIPENRFTPITADETRKLPLTIEQHNLSYDHPLASVPVFPFPPWVISAQNRLQVLEEYLSSFPTIKGFDSWGKGDPNPESSPAFVRWDDGWGELQMNWMVDNGRMCNADEQLDYMRTITRPYLDNLYFFPGVAGSEKSIHPLMAWWAVLFVLSMLARYDPSRWGRYIDVNESSNATKLEDLLRMAIRTVPRLIAEAIEQVA